MVDFALTNVEGRLACSTIFTCIPLHMGFQNMTHDIYLWTFAYGLLEYDITWIEVSGCFPASTYSAG